MAASPTFTMGELSKRTRSFSDTLDLADRIDSSAGAGAKEGGKEEDVGNADRMADTACIVSSAGPDPWVPVTVVSA